MEGRNFFHRTESDAAQKFLHVMNVQPKFFSSSVARCSRIFFSVYAILHRKSFHSWLRFSWWFCPRTRLVFPWKKIRQMLLRGNEYPLRSSYANGKNFSWASLNSFSCSRLRMKHTSFQVLPTEPNLFFPSATHFSSSAQGATKVLGVFPVTEIYSRSNKLYLEIFFALIFILWFTANPKNLTPC